MHLALLDRFLERGDRQGDALQRSFDDNVSVDDALKAIEEFDNEADPLRAIAAYIISRTR